MRDTICCPICRMRQKVSEISYIKLNKNGDDQDEVKINGSYSSKVEAIVRLVLKLKSEDEDVKILIFSTWNAIIKLLKNALEMNNVENVTLGSSNTAKIIQKFKVSLHTFSDFFNRCF